MRVTLNLSLQLEVTDPDSLIAAAITQQRGWDWSQGLPTPAAALRAAEESLRQDSKWALQSLVDPDLTVANLMGVDLLEAEIEVLTAGATSDQRD